MYFVDSTGHTFNLPSFNYEPIGYEYYKNKYVFWIDNKDHTYCSINNFYIRPIYVLSDDKLRSIKLTIDSDVYGLLSSRQIQNNFINGIISLKEKNIVHDYIETVYESDDEATDETMHEIQCIEVESSKGITKYLYPFYVIGNSGEVGTYYTNVLIDCEADDLSHEYCPITVGGEFTEESEILYINGRNMGVKLPREIIRAVYNAAYSNDVFDEELYNEKLKEYMIEYMQIRGQIGNYNSAIKSLNWFGWGKHVSIVSLLQTDNQFMEQFIRDYFNTDSDILHSFIHFLNTTLISLVIWDNKETGKYNDYDLDADFIGENQPELESLLSKTIPVLYGGKNEETYYYRSYYNFMFDELLLKISALKYYYEKYFLPVHLSIHNASMHHKVYANDIKMMCTPYETYTTNILKLGIWDDDVVEFPMNNEVWLTEQVHYVDELYNEWADPLKYEDRRNVYYIHDTCANIPIKFLNYIVNDNGEKQYNDESIHIHLLLEKITSEADNVLYINKLIDIYNDIIHIYDITNTEKDVDYMMWSYSTDGGKKYSPYVLGISVLQGVINMSEAENATVIYSDDVYKINYNNTEYILTNETQQVYINDSTYIVIPSISDIHTDVLGNNHECTIYVRNKILLRTRLAEDKILKCTIEHNDIVNDITDDICIRYVPSSELFFESDFTFNSADEEYACLVIYPKMFNNVNTDTSVNRHGSALTNKSIDISYFINSKFRLRMLVNNKWYTYDFTMRMSDIRIEFGKLVYKYYNDDLKYSTSFNQLSYLSPDTLTFNSFMHEPRLTRVNDINFLENFIKYLNISAARYIDGSMLPSNEFYYYIDVNFTDELGTYSQRVYINDEMYGKNIVVPRSYFNYDVLFYLFLDKKLQYVFANNDGDNTYSVIGTDVAGALIFDDSEDDLYIDTNNYKLFRYDTENNCYIVETSDGDKHFPINESFRSDLNTFTSKYIETHRITNNYKYLNQVHVFDLYRLNPHNGFNILSISNNIDLRYHGIRMQHDTFLNGNQIHVSGYISNLFHDNEHKIRDNDNKTFQTNLPSDPIDNYTYYKKYSSYVNTYDDLVIYSAYEGDWLRMTDKAVNPTTYMYYEVIDDNGVATGEYTINSTNVRSSYIPVTYIAASSDIQAEYIDIYYLENIKDLTSGYAYVDNVKYHIYSSNNSNNIYDLYINKDNINVSTTPVIYTAELYETSTTKTGDTAITLINPTYNEYVNEIRNELNKTNNSKYMLRLHPYIVANHIVNNIQRLWNGNVEQENGNYYARIRGQRVQVIPTYMDEDGNYDTLFNTYALQQQPGFDWVNINDVNTVIDDIYTRGDELDYIELIDSNDIEDVKKKDSDVKHIMSYRKKLAIDVTNRMIEALKSYENTQIFKEICRRGDDKVRLTLEMNVNKPEGDSNNVVAEIALVTHRKRYYNDNWHSEYKYLSNAKYNNHLDVKIDKDRLKIYDEDIYDDDKTTILEPKGVRCEHILGKNKTPYECSYDSFIAFITLIPGDNTGDSSFEFDINPFIRLVYDDYDLLEYPADTFIPNIKYYTDDYVDYVVGDVHYKYGDARKSNDVIKLYNEFFNTSSISIGDKNTLINVNCKPELNIDKNNVMYDMYLMHDLKHWYILYISKDTCDKTLALYDYELDDDVIIFNTDEHKYRLVKNTSTKRFLINRYEYVSKNGKNHFNVDDIVVGKVMNNNRLPIDIFKNSKWEITPVSILADKTTTTSTSNIDMCIFDIPTNDNEYVKGYYDVTYRYSLDRISTQQYKKYGTIRIG